MAHQSKSSAKAWNPPAQKGKPRTGEDVASTTECTGLTPAEPEDLEEAYALGELYAVHTLRPNEQQPSQ